MMPYTWNSLVFHSEPPKVATSSNGIYVVSNLTNDVVPAYNHRFKKNHSIITKGFSDGNILLKHFDISGNLLNEKLFGTENSDNVKGLAVLNNEIVVVVNGRRKKNNGYSSSEWDIGMFSVGISDFAVTYTWLNIDKEDQVYGSKIFNNQLYIYGVTGFKQIDTNSWVSHCHAFYAVYDSQMKSIRNLNRFKGERSSHFYTLLMDNSTLYSIGVTNAPITHSSLRGKEALLMIKK